MGAAEGMEQGQAGLAGSGGGLQGGVGICLSWPPWGHLLQAPPWTGLVLVML